MWPRHSAESDVSNETDTNTAHIFLTNSKEGLRVPLELLKFHPSKCWQLSTRWVPCQLNGLVTRPGIIRWSQSKEINSKSYYIHPQVFRVICMKVLKKEETKSNLFCPQREWMCIVWFQDIRSSDNQQSHIVIRVCLPILSGLVWHAHVCQLLILAVCPSNWILHFLNLISMCSNFR